MTYQQLKQADSQLSIIKYYWMLAEKRMNDKRLRDYENERANTPKTQIH